MLQYPSRYIRKLAKEHSMFSKPYTLILGTCLMYSCTVRHFSYFVQLLSLPSAKKAMTARDCGTYFLNVLEQVWVK